MWKWSKLKNGKRKKLEKEKGRRNACQMHDIMPPI
jgi:hypothetical protein